MSQSVLGSISVVLVALAFAGIVWWAFSKHKKKDFDEAANLPFEDIPLSENGLRKTQQNDENSENKS